MVGPPYTKRPKYRIVYKHRKWAQDCVKESKTKGGKIENIK